MCDVVRRVDMALDYADKPSDSFEGRESFGLGMPAGFVLGYAAKGESRVDGHADGHGPHLPRLAAEAFAFENCELSHGIPHREPIACR